MSINISNPLKKLDLDKVFIVHTIEMDETYKSLKLIDTHIMDIISGNANIKVTVFKTMRAVALDTRGGSGLSKTKKVYVDLNTSKEFDALSNDEINSSYKGPVNYVPIPTSMFAHYKDGYYRTYKRVGFPVNIRVLAKQLLKRDLPQEMSIRAILKLLDEINALEQDKTPVLLSSDKFEAAMQLSNIIGIETEEIYADKKVQDIVNKIMMLCNTNQDVYLNYVKNEINIIFEKYNNSKKENKPKFQRNNDINLAIEKTDPKTQLIIDLDILFNSLSTEIKLINYLDELYKCKRIISATNNKNDKTTQLTNDVLSILNAIKYLNNKEDKTKDLESLIDTEIQKATKELSEHSRIKRNGSDIELVSNTDKPFKQVIKELNEEYTNKANIYKPFVDLKEALVNREPKNFSEGNNITDLIESISFVINNIENKKLKEETQKQFEEVKQKYIQKLNTILSNENLVYKTDYKKIEIDLRQDLDPLLKKLNNIENKNLNQIFSTESLLIQVNNSIECINNNTISDEDYKKEPITSLVIDIIKDLIDTDEVKQIKTEVLNLLNEQKNILQNTKINSYEEYYNVRREIMKNIMSIKFDIQNYKNNEIQSKR